MVYIPGVSHYNRSKNAVGSKSRLERVEKKPGILRILLIGAAGVACLPFPILLAFVPGYFGYLLLAGGPVSFLGALFIGGAGAVLLGGTAGLWMLACLLLGGLCLYVCLKRRRSYFDTALALCALFTVLLYAAVSYQDLIAGAPAFHTMQELFRQALLLSREQVLSMLSSDMRPAFEMFESMAGEFIYTLPTYMPAAICVVGAIGGLTNLLWCVRACRRANVQIKPLHKLAFWSLPKSFNYGVLIMLGGVLLAYLVGVEGMQAVTAAVGVIVVLPFAVQGLCVYRFLFSLRPGRNGMLVVMVVLLVLAFPFSIYLLAGIGVLEQFAHIRRRFINRGTGGNTQQS